MLPGCSADQALHSAGSWACPHSAPSVEGPRVRAKTRDAISPLPSRENEWCATSQDEERWQRKQKAV